MGDITLPLNFLVCRMFLLLVSVLSFAAVPCMANGSDGQSLRHMMREREEDIDNELPAPEDIVNDISEDIVDDISEDIDNDISNFRDEFRKH